MQGVNSGAGNTQMDLSEQRLIFKGRLDPSVDNRGFAGITRVVLTGGSAHMDKDTLVVENASSLMLLTRIEYFPEYSEEEVEALGKSLDELTPDYPALLERARKVQSEMFNRVSVDFGGASKYGLSSEELLSDQRIKPGLFRRFSRDIFRDVPLLVHYNHRQVSHCISINQCQYQPAGCTYDIGLFSRRRRSLLQMG